jgi:hypothetical protein
MTVRELIGHLLARNIETMPLPINWDKRRLATTVRVAVTRTDGTIEPVAIDNVATIGKHVVIYVTVEE